MTRDEFLEQYHEFTADVREIAEREAIEVNSKAKGFHVVVQELPPFGFCLILDTTVDFLKMVGIL